MALGLLHAAEQAYRKKDFSHDFVRDKGNIVEIRYVGLEASDADSLFSLRLVSDAGIDVRLDYRRPAGGGGPFPALILLGGLRTGKETIAYAGETPGLALLALDYPYEGKKTRLAAGEFLQALPEIRRALFGTYSALQLSVDYLLARPEIDPSRIVFVGGSLGALFGPGFAAADERVAGFALLFGGGDLKALIRANLDLPGIVKYPVGRMGSLLASPFEPLKYIDRIAPRPLFLLNGRHDPRIPPNCSERLYEGAGNPKTMHWVDAAHLDIRSREFHREVRGLLADWLAEHRFVSRVE